VIWLRGLELELFADEVYEDKGEQVVTPVVPLNPERINAHLGTKIETSMDGGT